MPRTARSSSPRSCSRATPARRTARRRCSWSCLRRSRRSAMWDQDESPDAEAESQRLSQRSSTPPPVQEEDAIDVPLLDLATTSRRAPSTGSTSRPTDTARSARPSPPGSARCSVSDGSPPADPPVDVVQPRISVPTITSFDTSSRGSRRPARPDVVWAGSARSRDPTGASRTTQSRHANAASVAIPWRARAGVIDHPSSTSSTPSTCWRIGPTLPRNSPSRGPRPPAARTRRPRTRPHPLDPSRDSSRLNGCG